LKKKLLVYILLFLITSTISVIISTDAKGITIATSDHQMGISKGQIVGLAIGSAFSPGISLLQIAYHAKMEQLQIAIIWVLAGINFLLDKIPLFASMFQIFEYLIIWVTTYVGLTHLGGSPLMWILAAFIGTCVQFVRQVYTVGTDMTIAGAPVRGFIEDTISLFIVFGILSLVVHP